MRERRGWKCAAANLSSRLSQHSKSREPGQVKSGCQQLGGAIPDG